MKLPNAPLQEVIADLRWHLKSNELENHNFFVGDYYNKISKVFPIREIWNTPGMPFQIMNGQNVKFNKSESQNFPFVILRPDTVALNINGKGYEWEDYIEDIKTVVEPAFTLVQELNISSFKHVHLSLEYFNFYEFDFEEKDVTDFLRNQLHTEVNTTDFLDKKTEGLNLDILFKEKGLGTIHISYSRGKLTESGKSGVIVSTLIKSGVHPNEFKKCITWYEKARFLNRDIFQKMTKGKLYDSFS